MRNDLLSLLSFLALCLPTALELWNDREGDFNKGADVFVRMFFMAFVGFAVHFAFGMNGLASFNLSAAIFFLTFDYIISYILIRNGTLEPPRGVKYHWWTYEAKAGLVDNIPFWRNMNPWVKLTIRVVYFGISLYLFLTIR